MINIIEMTKPYIKYEIIKHDNATKNTRLCREM